MAKIVCIMLTRFFLEKMSFFANFVWLQYEFWLEDERQEYRMDCLLCGFAEDSISVMPYDPRKAAVFHETWKFRTRQKIAPRVKNDYVHFIKFFLDICLLKVCHS